MHTDETRGVIIGGDYHAGRLFYDGRSQGAVVTGDSETEVETALRAQYEVLKAEMGEVFALIYPGDCWEVRIYR